MVIRKEKTIQQTVISEIKCNKCGADMFNAERFVVFGTHIHVIGEYESPVIEDCKQYDFDLCEACLMELMKTFKIPASEDSIYEGEEDDTLDIQ